MILLSRVYGASRLESSVLGHGIRNTESGHSVTSQLLMQVSHSWPESGGTDHGWAFICFRPASHVSNSRGYDLISDIPTSPVSVSVGQATSRLPADAAFPTDTCFVAIRSALNRIYRVELSSDGCPRFFFLRCPTSTRSTLRLCRCLMNRLPRPLPASIANVFQFRRSLPGPIA